MDMRNKIKSICLGDSELSRLYNTTVDHVLKIKLGDLLDNHDAVWFSKDNNIHKVHINKKEINIVSNGSNELFVRMITKAMEKLTT